MSKNPRTVSSRIPFGTLVRATTIAITLFAFILFAVWQSSSTIIRAKMTGTVAAREFSPFDHAEHQITLNQKGDLTSADAEGEYILQVGVPQPDGSTKMFTVWLPDKKSFDAVHVGDAFDVGPCLAPARH